LEQKDEQGLQYVYSKSLGNDRTAAEKVKTMLESLKSNPPKNK